MTRIDAGQAIEAINALGVLAQLFGRGGKAPRFVRKLGDGFARALGAAGVVQPVGDLVDRARLSGCTVRVQALDAEGVVVEEYHADTPAQVAGLDDVFDGVEDVALRVRAQLRG